MSKNSSLIITKLHIWNNKGWHNLEIRIWSESWSLCYYLHSFEKENPNFYFSFKEFSFEVEPLVSRTLTLKWFPDKPIRINLTQISTNHSTLRLPIISNMLYLVTVLEYERKITKLIFKKSWTEIAVLNDNHLYLFNWFAFIFLGLSISIFSCQKYTNSLSKSECVVWLDHQQWSKS